MTATATRYSKSRTFGVILALGDRLVLYTVFRRINVETGEKELVSSNQILPWPAEDLSGVVNLIAQLGATARYYDPAERNWLDYSQSSGLIGAPGNPDGSWSIPSLEEFEEEYLPVI